MHDKTRARLILLLFLGCAVIIVVCSTLLILDRMAVSEIQDIVFILGPTISGFVFTTLSYLGLISVGGDLRNLPDNLAKIRSNIVIGLVSCLFVMIVGIIIMRGLGRLDFSSTKLALAVTLSALSGFTGAALASYFRS